MMDLRKRNPDGSRWFGPCPPIPGLTPILEPLTLEQAEADYEEAAEIRDRVAGTVRADVADADMYTDADPEWLADVFAAHNVDADPGPILRPIIARIRDEQGGTRAQAAAQLVRMDTVTELADAIVKWASAEGLQAAEKFRRCEPPARDIISIGFELPAFMLDGVDRAMDITAAEKEWHENDMAARGMVYGWRPEMVAEYLAGVGAAVTTPYGHGGCPPMGPRPEGHSTFFGFVTERAAMFLNGHGVDRVLRTTGEHGGIYRVFAFVHTMRESHEGLSIGKRAARGHFDDYKVR